MDAVSPPGILTPLGRAWAQQEAFPGVWRLLAGTTLRSGDGKAEGVDMTLGVAQAPY